MTDGRHKILVVDDLLDWRATLSGLLEDEGYDVQVAGSRVQALELLSIGQFDLAVLDMRLDETDEDDTAGLDLAAEIRKRWPTVRIVIITGYGTPETMAQALEPDVQGHRLTEDFIPKTTAEDLVQIVDRVLAE